MSSLSEFLDPAYARQLMEELRLNVSMALSSLSRVGFDEAGRLYVRAGYIDDGYLRVRDQNWTGFSLVDMVQEAARALQGMLGAIEYPITSIAGALASVATDKLRASVVDALPESPFNITKVAGTALTARDWSGDLAKLQNLDVLLSTRASDVALKNTPVTVLASSTVTANGNSDAINTDYGSVITFFLDVTAVAGTSPTLDVYIDIQDPVSGNWVNQDKFAQVTTTGTWVLSVLCRSNRYRARWVLGGTTPSFTMSIGAVVIAK